MAMPRLIAPAKRLLEQGLKFGPFPLQSYQAYEANIDFEIRCVCACCTTVIPFNKSWKQKASYILCDLSSEIVWDGKGKVVISEVLQGDYINVFNLNIACVLINHAIGTEEGQSNS